MHDMSPAAASASASASRTTRKRFGMPRPAAYEIHFHHCNFTCATIVLFCTDSRSNPIERIAYIRSLSAVFHIVTPHFYGLLLSTLHVCVVYARSIP